MPLKYLLCPQCGSHRFHVRDKDGRQVFFHVDPQGRPFPTAESGADLSGLDFSEVRCCACSWSGPIRKLTRIFCQ